MVQFNMFYTLYKRGNKDDSKFFIDCTDMYYVDGEDYNYISDIVNSDEIDLKTFFTIIHNRGHYEYDFIDNEYITVRSFQLINNGIIVQLYIDDEPLEDIDYAFYE